MADYLGMASGKRLASEDAAQVQPGNKRTKRGRHASACLACHRRKQKVGISHLGCIDVH